MYKLVVSDLDGTLLNSDHEVTEASRKTIEQLKENNIKFAIATGRIYSSASDIANELDLDAPVIACNGAVIYDKKKEQILYDAPISKELCAKIIDVFKKHDIYFHFYSFDTVYGERNERLIKQYQEWQEAGTSNSSVKIRLMDDARAIIEEDVRIYKFGFYGDDEISMKVYKELEAIPELELYFSNKNLVDVMNKEANKGNGVEHLAEFMEVDIADVVTLGDNENDLSMIKVAGLGIAMGNGLDHVKENADYVTDNNDSDGLSKALNEKVLNGSK